jgi:hypothetical protein
MLNSCKSKCIPPYYAEEDLNKGESVCVDRCVAKIFATNLKIGEFMRNSGQSPETFNLQKTALATFPSQEGSLDTQS